MKKIIIATMLLLTGRNLLYAQQPTGDEARIRGEWILSKVETKLHAQEDGRLLEEKVFTTPESTHVINGWVPWNLKFLERECIVTHRNGMEGGLYQVTNNGELKYFPEERSGPATPLPVPRFVIRYSLSQEHTLVLHMPSGYYKDNDRGLAVRLEYTCYYQQRLK
ncbi:hypothetical protein FHW36_10419 [Chitinophaga polysaccharea]|uniref:Lipocalin-like protein n=1 Tax=Chitinophaga polysaccharea TaxID=1293035 RepID=A0A561PQE4_9BACT|nr:hypothetical protein [Chitinophaga polysaccharea]TWF40337.1 hypothetical protein FHW36_10419 [Chitinophaga polysaccharea]